VGFLPQHQQRSNQVHASGRNSISLGGFAMPDYVVQFGLTEFRLSGGPIDDCAAHQELFAAIGHAAMSWARFETHLDAIKN
jgi:hypothetical protein